MAPINYVYCIRMTDVDSQFSSIVCVDIFDGPIRTGSRNAVAIGTKGRRIDSLCMSKEFERFAAICRTPNSCYSIGTAGDEPCTIRAEGCKTDHRRMFVLTNLFAGVCIPESVDQER